MAKISDEIREFIDDEDLYHGQIAGLRRIADRIDTELVELQKDADGREVSLDTKELYDANGKKVNITSFAFRCDAYGYWSYWKAYTPDTRCDDGMFYVDGLYLTPPDSWERIADELDAWVDRPARYKEHKEFHTFADRIRKLAKEQGDE